MALLLSLESLLLQFLTPDNSTRRHAEEHIKQLAKNPQVVSDLIYHIRNASSPAVRQLAAVLLRKKITAHWSKLPLHSRHLVKQSLLDSIASDETMHVRRASANVISVIAKYAVPSGEWPELLSFLFQLSHSGHENHREVALILFSSLSETIGNAFQSHFSELQKILLKCLLDETSDRVRVAALKAVGSFLEFTQSEEDVIKFRDFIPGILNVSRHSLASGEEDIAVTAFEIFDELIESPAPLLGESVRSIVQFSLEVCSNQKLEMNTRHQAIQIISWLAKYKYNSLKKYKLIIPILQIICPLLAESDEQVNTDSELDGCATEVLDLMALHLSRHVFPAVLEFSSLSCKSANPKSREAAVIVLGVIAEGCSEHMKNKMELVLEIVTAALKDPDKTVRGAAAFALGQFAEYLQPEITLYFKNVLPDILMALDDVSEDVKEKSYYAMSSFCENMGDDIIPYLDILMAKLLTTLQNSPRKLQEISMSAISSVASAAEEAFVPYAEGVLELMKTFMILTKNEDLCARTRATELTGIVALSVGKPRMEPIIPPFIEAAISGFGLEYCELREYTHGFLSNMAEILNIDFAKYLPHVMPLVFWTCYLDDGFAPDVVEPDSDDDIDGLDALSSDDESHDNPKVRNIGVRTGILDERAAAIQALGVFALHTKTFYSPYLEESFKILVMHSHYFHEDVRLQTIIALKHLLNTAKLICQTHNDGKSKLDELFQQVMNICIKTMTEDDDKEVVAESCRSTAEIINDFDYTTAVEKLMPQLVEAAIVLLKEESACQLFESESDMDDDDIVHNYVLMDALSDLLPALAKAMGSHFAPLFDNIYTHLIKFAKATRPSPDRAMVVACFAEISKYMGAPISSYVDKIIPLVIKELGSSESSNRRNAAFCVGELCTSGGEPTLKHYSDILRTLYPLFGELEMNDAVRDNAAGAVAKMIMIHPEYVPLSQVFPVFLKVLPLKEDFEESLPVYRCISNLVVSATAQVSTFVPEIISLFAQVAVSQEETAAVKALIGEAFSHLLSLYGHQIGPVLSTLSPSHAEALASITAMH